MLAARPLSTNPFTSPKTMTAKIKEPGPLSRRLKTNDQTIESLKIPEIPGPVASTVPLSIQSESS